MRTGHLYIPVSNKSDVLIRQVYQRVPGCTVQELPFEGLQAGNPWPLPAIEDTRSIDKDVCCMILVGAGLSIAHHHLPVRLVGPPCSMHDLMLQMDIPVECMAMAEVCEILPYFTGSRIVCRPTGVGLERPGVAYVRLDAIPKHERRENRQCAGTSQAHPG